MGSASDKRRWLPANAVQRVLSAQSLDDGGVGHPAALAHRLQPVPPATLFQGVDERRHDAGTAGTKWVADRDGTAIDVGLGQVGTGVGGPGQNGGPDNRGGACQG
jgi:hypothetical protein